jgi:hypothetical protein
VAYVLRHRWHRWSMPGAVRQQGYSIRDRRPASWVTHDLTCCYQVMACADRALLDAWTEEWADVVDFVVIPVMLSADAAESDGRSGDASPRLTPGMTTIPRSSRRMSVVMDG